MSSIAKIKGRGTVFAQLVSAVYVPMKGLTSIDISGEKLKTYESSALDGDQYEENSQNGYTSPPTIKVSGWFNPQDATYTNFEALLAPEPDDPEITNFKLTYTDDADTPTSAIYKGVGYDIGKKIAMDKGVIADLEITTTGKPT